MCAPDEGRRDCRRRGRWQTLEIALVHRGGAGVEARQAQRGGHRIKKRHQPANPSPGGVVLGQSGDPPLVHHERRRETKSHQIGEAVVLLAEQRLGVGPARDPSVQAVAQHREKNRHCGAVEVTVNRRDDRVETGKQGAGRQQVRQQEHTPPAWPDAGGLVAGTVGSCHGPNDRGSGPGQQPQRGSPPGAC